MYPFERFSDAARNVLTLAQQHAERSHQSYIGTEHLLLGLLDDEHSIAGKALKDLRVDEARLRTDIEASFTARKANLRHIIPTSRVKRVIELSFEEARREGANYVGTEHMLLALLVEGTDADGKLLAAQGVTIDRARTAIERVRGAGVQERAREERTKRLPGSAWQVSPAGLISFGHPSERFSVAANEALALAMQESQRAHHSYIGTEHLLLGLMQQDGLAGTALKALGIQIGIVRQTIESVLGRNERIVIQQIVPTSRTMRVIQIAVDDAGTNGSPHVTTADLLVALLTEGEGIAAHVLEDLGVTPDRVRDQVAELRKAGVDEGGGGAARTVELLDSQGRPINLVVTFPPGYSEQECEALLELLKDALRRAPGT